MPTQLKLLNLFHRCFWLFRSDTRYHTVHQGSGILKHWQENTNRSSVLICDWRNWIGRHDQVCLLCHVISRIRTAADYYTGVANGFETPENICNTSAYCTTTPVLGKNPSPPLSKPLYPSYWPSHCRLQVCGIQPRKYRLHFKGRSVTQERDLFLQSVSCCFPAPPFYHEDGGTCSSATPMDSAEVHCTTANKE